jgi:hypothetical protein
MLLAYCFDLVYLHAWKLIKTEHQYGSLFNPSTRRQFINLCKEMCLLPISYQESVELLKKGKSIRGIPINTEGYLIFDSTNSLCGIFGKNGTKITNNQVGEKSWNSNHFDTRHLPKSALVDKIRVP